MFKLSNNGNYKFPIIVFILLLVGAVGVLVYAYDTIPDTDKNFQYGSCDSNCTANSTGVYLNAGQNRSIYYSPIFDSGSDVNWRTINWTCLSTTDGVDSCDNIGLNVSLQARTIEQSKTYFDASTPNLIAGLYLNDTNGDAKAIDVLGDGYLNGTWTANTNSCRKIWNDINVTCFDGTGDLVNTTNTTILDNLAEGTIAFWVVLDNTPSTEEGLVGTRSGGINGNFTSITVSTGHSVKFNINNDSDNQVPTSGDLHIGVPHFYVANWNTSGHCLYQDGVLLGGACSTYGGGIPNGAGYFQIGEYFGGEARSIDGSISDVAVYNTDLRPEEILNVSFHHGGGVPFWNYHDIGEQAGSETIANFTAKMEWLFDSGYSSITFENFYQWRQGNFTMPTQPFLVMFDDASAGLETNAKPVMDRFGFVGNLVFITNLSGGGAGVTLMSWETAQEFLNDGWDIASHSIDSDGFFALSATERDRQLSTSKNDIIGNLSVTPRAFIFPGNEFNSTLLTECRTYYDFCSANSTNAQNVFSLPFHHKATNMTGFSRRQPIGAVTTDWIDEIRGDDWESKWNSYNETNYIDAITNTRNDLEESRYIQYRILLEGNGTDQLGFNLVNISHYDTQFALTWREDDPTLVQNDASGEHIRNLTNIWLSSSTGSRKDIASNSSTITQPIVFTFTEGITCSSIVSAFYKSDTWAFQNFFNTQADLTNNCTNNQLTITLTGLEQASSSNNLFIYDTTDNYILNLETGRFTMINSPTNLAWQISNTTNWTYEHGDNFVRGSAPARTFLNLIPLFFVLGFIIFIIFRFMKENKEVFGK